MKDLCSVLGLLKYNTLQYMPLPWPSEAATAAGARRAPAATAQSKYNTLQYNDYIISYNIIDYNILYYIICIYIYIYIYIYVLLSATCTCEPCVRIWPVAAAPFQVGGNTV